MSEIIWEEPPPASDRRTTTGSDAQALMAQPGRWARLATYPSKSTAYSSANRIKNAASLKWRPAGAFEAVVRRSGDAWALYARYVGEDGPR